jgi:hypothetical protein
LKEHITKVSEMLSTTVKSNTVLKKELKERKDEIRTQAEELRM